MVEKDVLTNRLTHLECYLSDLEEARLNYTLEQFRTDKIIRRYAERTLHMAVEACLGIANHIVSYQGLREPKNNQDVFVVRGEARILEPGMVSKLRKMAQFRNVIVHDYVRVNPEIVHAIMRQHLDDLKEYGRSISTTMKDIPIDI